MCQDLGSNNWIIQDVSKLVGGNALDSNIVNIWTFFEYLVRSVFRGWFLGSNPHIFGFFFQFARVLKEKIPKPPLNFPVYTKKFQNSSLEKFLNTPLYLVISNSMDPLFWHSVQKFSRKLKNF